MEERESPPPLVPVVPSTMRLVVSTYEPPQSSQLTATQNRTPTLPTAPETPMPTSFFSNILQNRTLHDDNSCYLERMDSMLVDIYKLEEEKNTLTRKCDEKSVTNGKILRQNRQYLNTIAEMKQQNDHLVRQLDEIGKTSERSNGVGVVMRDQNEINHYEVSTQTERKVYWEEEIKTMKQAIEEQELTIWRLTRENQLKWPRRSTRKKTTN